MKNFITTQAQSVLDAAHNALEMAAKLNDMDVNDYCQQFELTDSDMEWALIEISVLDNAIENEPESITIEMMMNVAVEAIKIISDTALGK